MSKAFSNLLKHIDKLSHTDKERVFQWVKRYVEPSPTVRGRLIDEMQEARFKDGFECPYCTSEYINRYGKVNGRQRYRCKACRKTWINRFKGCAFLELRYKRSEFYENTKKITQMQPTFTFGIN